MRSVRTKAVLLLLGGLLALGLVALAWAIGAGSSEAQQGTVHNCPQPAKWAISVWSGQDGTDTGEALATCGPGAIDFAYYIDPDTQQWLRYFVGRAEISNLLTLDHMQGVIAHGPAPTPTPTPAPVPSPSPTPTPMATPVSGEVAITGELVAIFTYLTTFQPPDFITTTTTIVGYSAAIEDDSGNLMLLFSPDTRMQRVYGNGLELILTVAGYTYTHSWPFMDEPLPSCRGARVYLSRSGKRITVTGVVEAFTGCPIEGDRIHVETIEEVP